MLDVPRGLPRTSSELAKAREEAESITLALRRANRSAVNLGSFAQRVSQQDKDMARRKSFNVNKNSSVSPTILRDPTADFGMTLDVKRQGPRSIVGEQKKTFLPFDTKEFKMLTDEKDDENSSVDDNEANNHSDVTEDDLDYRDLVFYLFDGFSRADLAGLFPYWYEASLWAERINFLFVMLSIVAIATETLPLFYNENMQQFAIIEILCISYFTLDLVARISCTRQLGKFFRSALNWVDIISILPFYIGLVLNNAGGSSGSVIMLRYFRLLRILRVLKLSRRNVGLIAVWEALRESSEAITLLGFLIMVALLMFSSLMFYAEQFDATFDPKLKLWMRADGTISPFQSIFHTMWWCIVTMSTVGYGDDVPVTVFGKLVGGATMICGVFVLAFPTVILSTNFQEIHQSKVDGHMQMQQIYSSQREAARQRAAERQKRREDQQKLDEELAEVDDGGEVEDPQRVVELNASQSVKRRKAPARDRESSTAKETPTAQSTLLTTFKFAFNPYERKKTQPADSNDLLAAPAAAITMATAELFADGNSQSSHNREVVIVDNAVALYNPVLHFLSHDGALKIKVEHYLTRSVVTMYLVLESLECQLAAEAAVERNRPDLFSKIHVLPRPISKLKVDIICDHPLLHDIRLQSCSFTDPVGSVPLSLLVPYPSLVSVLLANISSLTVMTWVAYESPSAIDEPLFHYGGAILGGTDFEEEEVDYHARKLLSDPSARTLELNSDGASPGTNAGLRPAQRRLSSIFGDNNNGDGNQNPPRSDTSNFRDAFQENEGRKQRDGNSTNK